MTRTACTVAAALVTIVGAFAPSQQQLFALRLPLSLNGVAVLDQQYNVKYSGANQLKLQEDFLEEECLVNELNAALAERDKAMQMLGQAQLSLARSNAERELLSAHLRSTESALAEYKASVEESKTKMKKKTNIVKTLFIGGGGKGTSLGEYSDCLKKTVRTMAPFPESQEIKARIENVIAYLGEWVDPSEAREIVKKELASSHKY